MLRRQGREPERAFEVTTLFKNLENDVVILAALTNIETDWHQGVAYVGMSRACSAVFAARASSSSRMTTCLSRACRGRKRN